MTVREMLKELLQFDHDPAVIEQHFGNLDAEVTAGMHGNYMPVKTIETSHDGKSMLFDMAGTRH